MKHNAVFYHLIITLSKKKSLLKMDECIFCNITQGNIPANKVYENDSVICFLDIMPANKGHCLVVPKKHHETLLDMPDEALKNLILTTKKVAKALSLSIGNGSYNIVMNNGKTAGQVVAHAHIHIIPRFNGDRLRIKWSRQRYTDEEMRKTQEKIKKFV